ARTSCGTSSASPRTRQPSTTRTTATASRAKYVAGSHRGAARRAGSGSTARSQPATGSSVDFMACGAPPRSTRGRKGLSRRLSARTIFAPGGFAGPLSGKQLPHLFERRRRLERLEDLLQKGWVRLLLQVRHQLQPFLTEPHFEGHFDSPEEAIAQALLAALLYAPF